MESWQAPPAVPERANPLDPQFALAVVVLDDPDPTSRLCTLIGQEVLNMPPKARQPGGQGIHRL
jgi:hypothetical protein